MKGAQRCLLCSVGQLGSALSSLQPNNCLPPAEEQSRIPIQGLPQMLALIKSRHLKFCCFTPALAKTWSRSWKINAVSVKTHLLAGKAKGRWRTPQCQRLPHGSGGGTMCEVSLPTRMCRPLCKTGPWLRHPHPQDPGKKTPGRGHPAGSLGSMESPGEIQQQALTDSVLLQGDLSPHSVGDAFLHAFGTSGSLRKRSHFPLHSNKQTKHFCFCSKVGCDLVSHTKTSERRRNSMSLPESELTWTLRQGWIQHRRFSPQPPSQALGAVP